MGTGKIVKVSKGDAYVFDNHEAHFIKGGPEGAEIICIFTPACTGQEVCTPLIDMAQKVFVKVIQSNDYAFIQYYDFFYSKRNFNF